MTLLQFNSENWLFILFHLFDMVISKFQATEKQCLFTPKLSSHEKANFSSLFFELNIYVEITFERRNDSMESG